MLGGWPGPLTLVKVRTRASAPASAPTTISALPSPLMSPVATNNPPRKLGSKAKKRVTASLGVTGAAGLLAARTTALPSINVTSGALFGPKATITSAMPSPVTSPVATCGAPNDGIKVLLRLGANTKGTDRTLETLTLPPTGRLLKLMVANNWNVVGDVCTEITLTLIWPIVSMLLKLTRCTPLSKSKKPSLDAPGPLLVRTKAVTRPPKLRRASESPGTTTGWPPLTWMRADGLGVIRKVSPRNRAAPVLVARTWSPPLKVARPACSPPSMVTVAMSFRPLLTVRALEPALMLMPLGRVKLRPTVRVMTELGALMPETPGKPQLGSALTEPTVRSLASRKETLPGAAAAKTLTSLPRLRLMLPPLITPRAAALMVPAPLWRTSVPATRRTVAGPALMGWAMVRGPLPLWRQTSLLEVVMPLVPRTVPMVRPLASVKLTLPLVAAVRRSIWLAWLSRNVPVPCRRSPEPGPVALMMEPAFSVMPAALRSTVALPAVMSWPLPSPRVSKPVVASVTLPLVVVTPLVRAKPQPGSAVMVPTMNPLSSVKLIVAPAGVVSAAKVPTLLPDRL